MPTTITAYNTFVANTKARASEVNANFSNHRGTLIPITEDTATASNNTYDLGTTEYAWANGYINNIVANTVQSYSFYGRGDTSTMNLLLRQNSAATQWDFLVGGNTALSLDNAGGVSFAISRDDFPITDWTLGILANSRKGIAQSVAITTQVLIDTSGATGITLGSLSISIAGPTLIFFRTGHLYFDNTAPGGVPTAFHARMQLEFNGSTVASERLHYSPGPNNEYYIPLSGKCYFHYDTPFSANPTSGTLAVVIYPTTTNSTNTSYLGITTAVLNVINLV